MQVTINFGGDLQIAPPSPALKKLQSDLEAKRTQLYGASVDSEIDKIIQKVNKGSKETACAKPLRPGDAAWKCFDC